MTGQVASRDPRTRFNALVAHGAYGPGFDHASAAQAFVARVVDGLLNELAARTQQPRILDAGCGTGVWMAFLSARARALGLSPHLYGFDVADRMVETAQAELAGVTTDVRLRRADLQNPACCCFDDGTNTFDLVFAYDVIQQLNRRDQMDAVMRLAEAMVPGGATVIFDHERWSRYGLRMGWKKFVTANTGIPIVPRHYCAAAYPPLDRFARRLRPRSDLNATVVTTGHPAKRALVLRRTDGI